MTKKLICPNCKEELEYVKEYSKEIRVYTWKINTKYNEADTFDDECYDSDTQYFECPECNFETPSIDDFIEEET